MKKIVIYLVCITIFLQFGFQSLQLAYQMVQHKIMVEANIRNGIYQDFLISFNKFDLKDAKWESEMEFELNCQKFDVAYLKNINGDIYYYCLNDEVEKIILFDLEKANEKSKTDTEQSLKIDYFCAPIFELSYKTISLACQNWDGYLTQHLLFGYPTKIEQPPTSII